MKPHHLPHANRPHLPHLLLLALLAAPLLIGAPFAQASERPSGHPKMGGSHGAGYSMGHGKGYGSKGHHGSKKSMQPHNAAVHFLQMAPMLGLEDTQKEKLQQLRDAYTEQFAADAERLQGAKSDLKGLIHSDPMDMKAIEKQLVAVGKLEGRLWRGFVRQLHDIKAMLNDDQKARMHARHMRKHGQ